MTGQVGGHIGTRIRLAREARDITQTQLAAALGVRERTVSRWESGINVPDTRHLRGMARELGVSILWLLGEPGPNGESKTVVAA